MAHGTSVFELEGMAESVRIVNNVKWPRLDILTHLVASLLLVNTLVEVCVCERERVFVCLNVVKIELKPNQSLRQYNSNL